jgi:hypothetical protein
MPGKNWWKETQAQAQAQRKPTKITTHHPRDIEFHTITTQEKSSWDTKQ